MAQLNINEATAFDETDYEYENAETIPTEFIKVEHIYDIMSDDFSEPEESYNDVTCDGPIQPDITDKDPLAPDPETKDDTGMEVIPTKMVEIKMELPDDPEQDAEQAQYQENNGDLAAAMSPVPAFDDDDSSQSSTRVTRSQSKQSSQPQNTEGKEEELENTRGEAAEASAGAKSTDTGGESSQSILSSTLWCPFCERSFASQKSLKQHVNVHLGEKPFICSVCGMGFSWEGNMKRHVRNVHKKSKNAKKQTTTSGARSSTADVVSNGNDVTTMTASISNSASLRAPASSADAMSSAIPSEGSESLQIPTFNKEDCHDFEQQPYLAKNRSSDDVSPSQDSRTRVHACYVCGRKFSSKSILYQHVVVHTGDKPYECTLCGMAFGWASSLQRHTRKKHKSRRKEKQSYKSEVKTNSVASEQAAAKVATENICVDQEVSRRFIPQFEKMENGNPQQKSLSDCNNQGSKRLILDHLRRHVASGHHQCNLCGRRFSSRWHLDRHVNAHPVMKPFRCPFCEKSFVWERNLKTHLCIHMEESDLQSAGKKIHRSPQITPAPNNISGTKAAEDDAISKATFVSEQVICNESLRTKQCSICSKRFTQLANLKRHMLKHMDIKPFSCLLCGKTFSRKDLLQTHRRWHCKDISFKVKKKQIMSSDKNDGNREKTSENLNEGTSATENVTKQSVSENVRDEMKEKTREIPLQAKTENNPVETDESAANCSNQVTKEQYQCILCPKQTNSKAAMLAHMQIHMGGNQTQCSICGINVNNLPRHMLQHTGEKLFQCTVCEKRFGRKEHLVKHELSCTQKSVHDVKQPDTQQHDIQKEGKRSQRQCHVCKKMFNRWYLKEHLLIHSGTKPLHCRFCSRTFRFKSGYLNHLKHHKKVKEESLKEKATTTGETGQISANKEIVNNNVTEPQVLEKYECSICGRYLNSKAELLCHELRHEDKRNSVCNICDKKLSSAKQLLGHMRIHTGEKPFECEVCKKKFIWKGSWKNHIKSHIQGNNLIIDKEQSELTQMSGGYVENPLLGDLKLKETILSGNLKQTKKGNSFHTQTISKFMKKHQILNRKKFHCKVCDKTIPTRINFFIHMQSHSKEGMFSCSICHKIFSRRDSLEIHVKSHTQISNEKSLKESSGINSEEQKGKVCTKIEEELLTFPKDLLAHKSSQSSTENQTDELSSVNNLKNHSEVTYFDNLETEKLLDKKVSCKIDSDISDRDVILVDTDWSVSQGNTASQGPNSRRESFSSQTQQRERSSVGTSQSFEKRNEMTQSEDKTYEGNRSEGADGKNTSLACKLCGKVFPQQSKLLRHLMNQGCSGPFECSVCHKKYSYKGRLDIHMLMHSEDSSKCDGSKKARSPLKSLQEPEVIIIRSRSPSPEKMSGNVSTDTQGFDNCGKAAHSIKVNDIKEKHNNENVINLASPITTPLERLADTAQPTATVSRDINMCNASYFAENRNPSNEMVTSGENKVSVNVSMPGKTCQPEITDVLDISEVNKPFECDSCKLTFDTQRALLLHSHTREKETESLIKCNFCPLTFTCEATRLNHLRIHEANSARNSKTLADSEGPESTGRVEKTEGCAKGDTNVRDENRRFSIEVRRTEQCKVCGEKYDLQNLVKHMSVHTGGISFQCGLCGKIFSTEAMIQNHAKKHDETIAINLICHICGQALTSSKALTDHVQEHSGQLTFRCRVCKQTFGDSFQLQVHVKCHNGEKPFHCKVCHKRFALKINQLKHLNTHYRKNRLVSTKVVENQKVMSKERTDVKRSIHLAKDVERKVGESSVPEGRRQELFLEAKPADKCTSKYYTEVRNHMENNLGTLIEAVITKHVVGETKMNQTDNSVLSNSNIPEINTTLGITTDSPSGVRNLSKSVVAARTSSFKVEENHKRKCVVQSDEAQITEVLGTDRLEMGIKSICDIPKQQKELPVTENISLGELHSERLLEVAKRGDEETSQRKKIATPSEKLIRNALAGSNLEFGNAAHNRASKLLKNCPKEGDLRSKHLSSVGEMPKCLEVKKLSGSSSLSAKTYRNEPDLGPQVSGGAMQTTHSKLQTEDSICDVALNIPKNRKHKVRAPTSGRHFSDKHRLLEGKVGHDPKLSSNNPVINCGVPVDTVIRKEAISTKVQDVVEVLQETAGNHSFSLNTPINLGGKNTVSYIEKEFSGNIKSGEITKATDSGFSQNIARKNSWQLPEITITRCVESQERGTGDSPALSGNRRRDIRFVEPQAVGTTVTKNAKIVEVVDVESENKLSPSSSNIPQRSNPQRTVADQQAQRGGCGQPKRTTCDRVAQQMEGTEFSNSFLPRRQLLPSARTEMAAEMNIMNARVGPQIDIRAAPNAGQAAHTVSTPLTQSILHKHQLALQSNFEMPGTWKETAMMSHPDHRGHGNSIHSIDPLMFAQPPGPWYGVSPTNFTPPGAFYGWVPQTPSYQANSSSNSVFMTKMPPPYPDNNIYKNYPPSAYNDSHLMQLVSSQRGETMNIQIHNKEDRRPKMP